MISNLLENTGQLIQSNPWLAFFAVFLGGLMTAANPCVIASIPLVMGFIGGTREKTGIGQAFMLSLTFALGLAVMFTVMGLVAALVGNLFGEVGHYWKYIIALVCLFVGLHLLRIFKFKIPAPKFIKPKTGGFVTAFLMGLMFGLVSAPCAAPILIIILTYIASQGNPVYGGLLLLTYSLAHCILILFAGTSIGIAKSLLEHRGLKSANLWMQRIGGILIIGVGIYLVII
ncbi:sulfite exporter TauE/SafE family protein [bacterium]|nr:sulfite exporter TauE/SafE family protein [bacterium]